MIQVFLLDRRDHTRRAARFLFVEYGGEQSFAFQEFYMILVLRQQRNGVGVAGLGAGRGELYLRGFSTQG